MTTKPKAKKFRISRPGDAAAASETVRRNSAAPSEAVATAPAAAQATRPPAAPPPAQPPEAEPPTDIDSIRKEGLTGRQLRMARRVAQKHALTPSSDYDAVRLLRERGIDPFQRSNMLQLVVPNGEADPDDPMPAAHPQAAHAQAAPQAARQAAPQTAPQTAPQAAPRVAGASAAPAKVQLPQKVTPAQVPSTETAAKPEGPSPAERRAAEIAKIQRELGARRRKKMLLLLTRLAAFVLLPTLLAGYYFYAVATPLYATKTEFLILKAEGGGGGGMGSLFSGTQFATNQDAIAVQSYLTSKDAMLRLDSDEGFKSHFAQDHIDPIQRLSPDPSNEEAYKVYKRMVKIGYDPTEGVIKMEVTAADPEMAAEFSRALVGYAEERVDNLSLRKRSNAVEDAEQGLIEAQTARQEAQEKLVRLQQEGAMVDPEGRIAALRGQINNIEIQLQEKQLQLQALLDNPRPNRAKVEGAEGDVRRLETLLSQLNFDMTTATTGGNSLAEKAVQIRLAEADLATRDLMLQSSLERLEQARRDADSQARYLTTSVVPVASEDPSYPRKFENTILSFLIFAGVYLMVSLTASILREQVST